MITDPMYKIELELARVNSYNRTISTIIDVKRALYQAPRDFWTCPSSQHVEGLYCLYCKLKYYYFTKNDIIFTHHITFKVKLTVNWAQFSKPISYTNLI